MHLVIACKQVEAWCFAPREQVHGKVVAQCGRGRHRIVLMQLAEFRESVVGLFVDHGALFNPADLVLVGLYLQEALGMIKHLEWLTVPNLAHTV